MHLTALINYYIQRGRIKFLALVILSLAVSYGKVFLFLLPLKILILIFPQQEGAAFSGQLFESRVWIAILLAAWLMLAIILPLSQSYIEKSIDKFRPDNHVLEFEKFSCREKTGGYRLTNEAFDLSRCALNLIVFLVISVFLSFYLFLGSLAVYILAFIFYEYVIKLPKKNLIYSNRVTLVLFFVLLGLVICTTIYEIVVDPFVVLITFFIFRSVNSDLSSVVDRFQKFSQIDFIMPLDANEKKRHDFILCALNEHGYNPVLVKNWFAASSSIPHSLDLIVTAERPNETLRLRLRICSMRNKMYSLENDLRLVFNEIKSDAISFQCHDSYERATWCCIYTPKLEAMSKQSYLELAKHRNLFLSRVGCISLNQDVNLETVNMAIILDITNPIYSNLDKSYLRLISSRLTDVLSLASQWPFVLMNPMLSSSNMARSQVGLSEPISWSSSKLCPLGFWCSSTDFDILKAIFMKANPKLTLDVNVLEIHRLLGEIDTAQKRIDGSSATLLLDCLDKSLGLVDSQRAPASVPKCGA